MPAAGEEFFRVGALGHPFFRLRPGELGISVFDPFAVDPPLTEQEILQSFRPGSVAVLKSKLAIDGAGLVVVAVTGATGLPQRLQDAHGEIRPGPGMTRSQFKRALGSLE